MNLGPRIAKAALFGGLLGGLFSALPYVNALNCCCCALVVLAGVFAGFVLLTDTEGRAGAGPCGLAGFLAGGLSGLISVPLGAVLGRLVTGEEALRQQISEAMRMLEANPQFGPEMRPLMESAMAGASGVELNAWTVLAACVLAVLFSFFGLLGGLASNAFLARRMWSSPPTAPLPRPFVAPPPPPPAASVQLAELGEAEPALPQGTGEIPHADLPTLPKPSAPDDPRDDDTPPQA